MRCGRLGATLALVVLSACATADEPPSPTPDLTPPSGVAAPPRARLYIDCIAQATASGAYDVGLDGDVELIRFTCTGDAAQAFFDALGPRSAAIGSEWQADGRVWRSTNKVRRDLIGVDYCWLAPPQTYGCVVVLNAGPFLTDQR